MINREALADYAIGSQTASPCLEHIQLSPQELALILKRRCEHFGQDPANDTIYNASTLLRKVLPPARWAVPDILPEGLTLLGGKPKMGKSWLGLGLAVAIATGGVALGSQPVQEGDVLYLALEDNERRMQSRLRTILQCPDQVYMLAPELERLHISHVCPRLGSGAEEYIRSWLTEHPDARLVIVDVLKKIRPARKSGNAYDDDYADAEPLQKLASEHGVAVLALTHLRKAGAADPLDTLNASLGLSGAADNVLVLTRDRGKMDAVLQGSGRDITELNLALRWDPHLAAWSVMGNAEEYKLSEESRDMLEVMRRIGKSVQPKDLYPHFPDKSHEAVRVLLHRMTGRGDAIVGADGKYSVNVARYRGDYPEQEKVETVQSL
ncbi:MAG: AAA family ATPase [Chloroflexia bacterium]